MVPAHMGDRAVLYLFVRAGEHPRMIWDCVMCGYESDLDVLECRMTQLNGIVDRFVIVESGRNFSGRPKKLWFPDGWDRLAAWHDRITYIAGPNTPLEGDDRPHEYDRRETGQAEHYRRALSDAHPDDWVLFGAADEIPRTELIQPGRVLGMRLHIYDLRTMSRTLWEATTICRVADLRAWTGPVMQFIYHTRYNWQVIPEGGWHLTYMGKGDEATGYKLRTTQPDMDTTGWAWRYTPLVEYDGDDYPKWVAEGNAPAHWWDNRPAGLTISV